MKDTMYNKYYEKLISMVMMMNNHAKEKDLLRNHTNYGSVSTLSQIIRTLCLCMIYCRKTSMMTHMIIC